MTVSRPTPNLPSFEILQSKLKRYRQTGDALHLADAACALRGLRLELQTLQAGCAEGRDVDSQEIAA
jgi:hypothetical protein